MPAVTAATAAVRLESSLIALGKFCPQLFWRPLPPVVFARHAGAFSVRLDSSRETLGKFCLEFFGGRPPRFTPRLRSHASRWPIHLPRFGGRPWRSRRRPLPYGSSRVTCRRLQRPRCQLASSCPAKLGAKFAQSFSAAVRRVSCESAFACSTHSRLASLNRPMPFDSSARSGGPILPARSCRCCRRRVSRGCRRTSSTRLAITIAPRQRLPGPKLSRHVPVAVVRPDS